MRIFLRLLGVLLLIAVAVAGWGAYEAKRFLETPPQDPGKEELFDVAAGERLKSVARRLAERGLVTDERGFLLLARWKKQDGRLQAGRFALHSGWTPERVLDALVSGRPVLHRITVREGLTWWQTARALAEAGFVTEDDFREVIADPAFLRHHGIPFANAEGFLMPDTYLLKKADRPGMEQARIVAARMVDNFWRRAARCWPDGRKPGVEDMKRLVILASIVEKETSVDAERARVAGVYANRLERKMLLQADPTVIYGLGPAFDGNLRRRHLEDAGNPYNTYRLPGLPPGPICSFGGAALVAAARPERHGFLFFVAKTDGGEHAFSTNLEDHNRAVREYLKNRRAGARRATEERQ